MKKRHAVIAILLLNFTSNLVLARDNVTDFVIKEVMTQEQAKEALGSDVRFYFGNQKHGKVLKSWGNVSTNKKTNAFLKSDEEACNWVFLSAMISLQKRALKEGGNAVINIKSNYKGKTTSSNTTFKCGAGNLIAGVALTGKVVKIR